MKKIHLISEEGEFNLNEKFENNDMENDVSSLVDNYRIISIVGPQSSGKSTIINQTFNTSMEVLDDKRRHQTTKGIWLSETNVNNVFILDCEGTDSQERGDMTQFEKRYCLFCLAISDVVLLNIWFHDIGREKATTFNLLRQIFISNVELYSESNRAKTVLCLTIRDIPPNLEGTGRNNVEKNLTNSLLSIWDSISEDCSKYEFSDLFELKFFFVPHFIHATDGFNASCLDLQTLMDPNVELNYLPKTNKSQNIPLQDFMKTCSDMWNIIQHDERLDVPSAKVSLAVYRVSKIASALLNEFEISNDDYDEHIEKYMEEFDKRAQGYSQDVVILKRNEFLEQLIVFVSQDFQRKIHNIYLDIKQEFDVLYESIFKKQTYVYDFEQKFEKMKSEMLEKYQLEIRSLKPKRFEIKVNVDHFVELLIDYSDKKWTNLLRSQAIIFQQEEIDDLVEIIFIQNFLKYFKNNEYLDGFLNNEVVINPNVEITSTSIWDSCGNTWNICWDDIKKTIAEYENDHVKKFKKFGNEVESFEICLQKMFQQLFKRISDYLANEIFTRLKAYFVMKWHSLIDFDLDDRYSVVMTLCENMFVLLSNIAIPKQFENIIEVEMKQKVDDEPVNEDIKRCEKQSFDSDSNWMCLANIDHFNSNIDSKSIYDKFLDESHLIFEEEKIKTNLLTNRSIIPSKYLVMIFIVFFKDILKILKNPILWPIALILLSIIMVVVNSFTQTLNKHKIRKSVFTVQFFREFAQNIVKTFRNPDFSFLKNIKIAKRLTGSVDVKLKDE
eukprot:TRINITY_DN96_c0_g1_i1.p1 TRINITY_DN96_c0_g1~~TRINITY_DN96_c0_g1_i1.p1  ORF type:complete len:781 (+),score=251.90 TRINITY_DN96_c0_g1_i1:29-2371(+)